MYLHDCWRELRVCEFNVVHEQYRVEIVLDLQDKSDDLFFAHGDVASTYRQYFSREFDYTFISVFFRAHAWCCSARYVSFIKNKEWLSAWCGLLLALFSHTVV